MASGYLSLSESALTFFPASSKSCWRCSSRLRRTSSRDWLRAVDWALTVSFSIVWTAYIFHPTSACLRFFSYWASMARDS